MHEPQTSKRMVLWFLFYIIHRQIEKVITYSISSSRWKMIGLWNNLYILFMNKDCHNYYNWENCIRHIFSIVLIYLLVIQKNNTFYSSFIKVIVYLICKGILSQHKNISFGESCDEILFVRIYFTSNWISSQYGPAQDERVGHHVTTNVVFNVIRPSLDRASFLWTLGP